MITKERAQCIQEAMNKLTNLIQNKKQGDYDRQLLLLQSWKRDDYGRDNREELYYATAISEKLTIC